MKDTICNVPVGIADVCNTLPRASDYNGLVTIELKWKLQYRGYVYFESVRPNFVFRLSLFLKVNKYLYYDIETSISLAKANLVYKGSTEDLLHNMNLLDYTKINGPTTLIIKGCSVYNNSDAVGDPKMLKTLHFIQGGSPIPAVIEGENIVNMDSFGTT